MPGRHLPFDSPTNDSQFLYGLPSSKHSEFALTLIGFKEPDMQFVHIFQRQSALFGISTKLAIGNCYNST